MKDGTDANSNLGGAKDYQGTASNLNPPNYDPIKDIQETHEKMASKWVEAGAKANPTPLPVKPSLEELKTLLRYSGMKDSNADFRSTIAFVETLLTEAEQRGYQKGFEESVRLAPFWAKIREENEDAYLAMVETVTKAEVAWSKTLDLAVREARKDELERIKIMFNLDWSTVKNQVVHRLAELSDKEVKE